MPISVETLKLMIYAFPGYLTRDKQNMLYSLMALKEDTLIRKTVVTSKYSGKAVFWSNGFNAVQDLKQKVNNDDHSLK